MIHHGQTTASVVDSFTVFSIPESYTKAARVAYEKKRGLKVYSAVATHCNMLAVAVPSSVVRKRKQV
jgi:hypothetical protein